MLNEVEFVKYILTHKIKLQSRSVFRLAFMIAKYLHEQGKENKDIRLELIKWARFQEISLCFDINSMIYAATKSKVPLKSDFEVWISDNDIETIKMMFDKPRTKLVALIILCLCKIEQTDEIYFNVNVLAQWLNKCSQHLHSRTLKELESFGYIERLKEDTEDVFRVFGNKKYYAQNKIKLLVDFDEKGEYLINSNNLDCLKALVE